jgi:heavy metal translocating P-type ATPase
MVKSQRYVKFVNLFAVPAFILFGIAMYFFLYSLLRVRIAADLVIVLTIFIGSIDLLRDTFRSIMRRQFVLDYVALLAIITGVASGELVVAAVIVLMLATGQTLEKYAVARAKKSLTALTDRIPSSVLLWEHGDIGRNKVDIASVAVGTEIFVRKGEVIPLDGVLVSVEGLADESSLTGEPYEIEKISGDTIRSGTINIGKPMIIRVTRGDKDSTYRKIVDMVKAAQEERSPLIRIADQYSGIFTVVTLILGAFAYTISRDIHQVLAVLVIATPCPLILATPIALIGGMNALARRKVITKTLASIEALSRVTDIMFDKTGTLTLGKPKVTLVDIKKKKFSMSQILGIAEAIERNSLHPLAKAIVREARSFKAKRYVARNVQEKIGYGITGRVDGAVYILSKVKGNSGIAIELRVRSSRIAVFHFEDKLKDDTKTILHRLKSLGLHLSIFTGDKKEATEQVLRSLGDMYITVKAECTPEDKMRGIKTLRQQGRVTAMVGDGINDAPALAAADVGLIFSNEEHTAASEAADLIFLGGDFSLVFTSLRIAKRTIAIALQSIWFGIGLSILGMILASLGYIPPLMGALLQEVIDVSVIFNALRASR